MAATTARPVIAITGPQRGARIVRRLIALGIYLAGGQPLQLRPRSAPQRFDGLVISGGHDIHPVLYAEDPQQVSPNYDQQRDEFESSMIDFALSENVPALGICRGAQLINVRLGGSLFQDINHMREKTSKRRTIFPLKTLYIDDHTFLSRLVPLPTIKINSLHNQAINRLGEGLVISAHDQDRIVQAVEDPHRRFLLGVQWHPEFLLFDQHQRNIFDALVTAADDSFWKRTGAFRRAS